MTGRDILFDLEGQKGVFQILIFLLEEEKKCNIVMKKDIIPAILGSGTAYRCFSTLEKHNLITIEEKIAAKRFFQISLTNKGRDVAKALISLSSYLDDI